VLQLKSTKPVRTGIEKTLVRGNLVSPEFFVGRNRSLLSEAVGGHGENHSFAFNLPDVRFGPTPHW
jgi:hypothetical protein